MEKHGARNQAVGLKNQLGTIKISFACTVIDQCFFSRCRMRLVF